MLGEAVTGMAATDVEPVSCIVAGKIEERVT